MEIEHIEFIDENAKEAIVFIKNEQIEIKCFSCPCLLEQGSIVEEPLECIDTKNVAISDNYSKIRKKENFWGYEFQVQIINREEGLVEADGIRMHIDIDEIPNDIEVGMYIYFETSRIDIW